MLKILLIMWIVPVPTIMYAEDNDGLELDPNAADSESYDNVSGSYKGFDFFDGSTVEKVEEYSQNEEEKIIDIQNDLLTNKQVVKSKYKDVSNKLLEAPIALNEVDENITQNYMIYYIIAGTVVGIFVLLFSNEYYKKKRNRRLNDDYDYDL